MRVKMSTNKNGQLYLPAAVRKVVKIPEKSEGNVEGVADTQTILLMPEGMTAEEALRSLKVIQSHLKHEAETQKEEKELQVTESV